MRHLYATAVTLFLVGGLAHEQKTAEHLKRYPAALVGRGEDWRGAIKWLNENVEENDTIRLESGLAEATVMVQTENDPKQFTEVRQDSYYLYPVRGPYDVEHFVALHHPSFRAKPPSDGPSRDFLLIRRHISKVEDYVRQRGKKAKVFGSLTIIYP